MTFAEIYDKFKNHSYIRRESWPEHIFIQFRYSAPLIRMVIFSETDTSGKNQMKSIEAINNDIHINATDLFAEDWIDIENC